MKSFLAFFGVLIACVLAFAQVVPVPPPVVVLPVEPADFFAQIAAAVASFGGLSAMLKISSVIMLVVASMKVSFLNDLVWSKLGAAKVWVAPLLGLIAGVLGLGVGDAPINFASILAFVTAGAGAVALHQLLDSIKAIPGIGTMYVTVINLIQGLLGGPKPPAA